MTTALLIDPAFERHQTGPSHPERPERIGALYEAFGRAGLLAEMPRIETRPATLDELALCHTAEYIATVRRDVSSGRLQLACIRRRVRHLRAVGARARNKVHR